MKEKILSIFILSLIAIQLNGQLFYKAEIHPKNQTIKGRYFHGTGGGNYWDIKTTDQNGRIINKKSYKRQKLLSERNFQYDKVGNETMSVEIFDINHPNQIDTNWVINYEYKDQQIIRQTKIYSKNDSTVIELVRAENNFTFVYLETSKHHRPERNLRWQDKKEHVLVKDHKGQLVKWTEIDIAKNKKVIKEFEYYPDGKKKRMRVKRFPEPELPAVYIGGPGGDDQYWEYRFDKEGRVKKIVTILFGHKYKIAKYKYKE